MIYHWGGGEGGAPCGIACRVGIEAKVKGTMVKNSGKGCVADGRDA